MSERGERLNSLPEGVVELYREFDDPIIYSCVNYFLSDPNISKDQCLVAIIKTLSGNVSAYKKQILDHAKHCTVSYMRFDSE